MWICKFCLERFGKIPQKEGIQEFCYACQSVRSDCISFSEAFNNEIPNWHKYFERRTVLEDSIPENGLYIGLRNKTSDSNQPTNKD